DRRARGARGAGREPHEGRRRREDRAAHTLGPMTLDPRAWAKTLGPVGAWSFDVERLGAEEARAHARDLEALNVPVLWIPESLGSKEVLAHARLLLGATKRLIL